MYYWDNLEVVKKLQNINLNRKYYTQKHKTNYLNAVLIIQKCIPTTFETKHIRGHQDRRRRKDLLRLVERLNIQSDHIIGANAIICKKINIKNNTIEVYVNKVYILNNYANIIKSHCRAQGTREFLQEKCQWTTITMKNIEWKLRINFIQRQTYSQKKSLLKFVH